MASTSTGLRLRSAITRMRRKLSAPSTAGRVGVLPLGTTSISAVVSLGSLAGRSANVTLGLE